jgi:hypothetical protein
MHKYASIDMIIYLFNYGLDIGLLYYFTVGLKLSEPVSPV